MSIRSLSLSACFWMSGMLAWLTAFSIAIAQPIIDGRMASDTAFYGPALSIQNTNTQFGDADSGDPINGGRGSEIDQIFATISEGRLYVLVAGNLEPNFNKLEVFIDSIAGGVNEINGSNLPVGVDAFCCGGFGTQDGALQRMDFLTFDTGFNADYFLSFMHGFEKVNPGMTDELEFWAMTAHYAELGQGTAGQVVTAGMQLAYRGLPNVLRTPGDFANTERVDAADYAVWRDALGSTLERGELADANGNGAVDDDDRITWLTHFGKGTSLQDYTYAPLNSADSVSQALLGPALPGLSPGQLIDRNYALGLGGCADDSGGCSIRELEFALGLDPTESFNESNHRNFNNLIDLRMAIDNSNTVGVSAAEPYFDLTTGDPQNVSTGIEFSIPLSSIGNPSGDIKLTIFINGLLHDFASNQFGGLGVLTGNFASLMPNLEFEAAGDQFVKVVQLGSASENPTAPVPEPPLAALAFVPFAWVAILRAILGRREPAAKVLLRVS